MAASYRNWLALYIIAVGGVLVIVNMCLIIHTVLMQKMKGDKWRFGRSSSGTSFPRLSRCVTWLFECCKKARMRVCCLCRGRGDKAGENQIQTTKTASNRSAANGGDSDIEALVPSLKTCLEPVKVLKVLPASSCPYYDRSKGVPAGNGPSRTGKPSNGVPKSAYVTEAAGSSCRTEKPTASASRSGTKKDQYAFNLGKVRSSIRRESLVALQSEEDISEVKAAASAPPATATATASIDLNPNIDNDDPIAAGKSLSTVSSKRQSTVSFANSADDASVSAQEDPPPPNANANSNSSNERRAEDEAIAQALLYIAAFIIPWIFPMIGRTMELQGKDIPFSVILLARIFTPAQGFFTILVYTRPHVKSIRKNNPEYSWFKAFGIAFKAGGDNDSVGQGGGGRRSNSLRPISDAEKKKKQDRITKDFERRMAGIERRKTVSANYDPATARAIREAAEQMELDAAAEDKDESQDEDEDKDSSSASQSKDDEDTGSCRLGELDTQTDGLFLTRSWVLCETSQSEWW